MHKHFLILACLLLGASLDVDASGQDTIARRENAPTLSPKFVTGDAIVFAQLKPAAALSTPMAKYLPTEIIDAWCEENVGILPAQVSGIRLVVPMPGPAGPAFGATILFAEDVSPAQLNASILDNEATVDVQGLECYELRPDPMLVLHAKSARHWVVGTRNYINMVVQSADQTADGGTMPKLLSEIPVEGNVQVVVALEPIRPLLSSIVQQKTAELPPQFAELPEFVELFDAAWLNVDPTKMNMLGLWDWTLRANSEADADRAEQILRNGIQSARDMFVPQLMAEIKGDDKVSEATRAYIQRISGELAELAMLQRDGRTFSLGEMDTNNIATVGVLVGLLLPAVQSAREAARRMSASNNLRQIGLAMHNYHAAHGSLPAPAICDDAGNPLLSWRVAILPFIEQQELYSRFHLDEPWDSPHNIALVDEMPETFVDPSIPPIPGMTVFKLPVAEGTAFQDISKAVKFREFLDGLSNTIMVVETRAGDAVPWTKPTDWKVAMNQPLDGTGEIHQGGFHVLIADGAVKFIADSIDPELFRGLLTHQGREIIGGL